VGVLCLLGSLAGCRPQVTSKAELYRWVHQPDHGLVQTRRANGLRLTAKYLPPQLLALQDWERMDRPGKKSWDSLLTAYAHTPSFLLTIEPDDDAQDDILFRGVDSYGAYKERAMDLNFRADQFVHLQIGSHPLPPVLHTLENTYSSRPGRSLYVVFAADPALTAAGPDAWDLVLSDAWFGTGINHFGFSRDRLSDIPEITCVPNE
jgi:hypothetical protein